MISHPARNLAALALTATLLATAGCGTPPWKQQASPAPSGRTASAAHSPSITPHPSATSVSNDLAKGSLKRTLPAGAAELKVTYWSTLDLRQWAPDVPKPLNVVASAKLNGGAKGQNVYLSAVQVASTATGQDGTQQALDQVEDTADVKPGYLVTKPNSYQQIFTLPAAAAGSTAMQITVTYELLIQSAPDSKTYLRQAASDTFQVPLVP